ncbi:hypothetical protein ACDX78_19960 [Virgibacillus oceani]
MKFDIHPLTSELWYDVEQLFNKHGACEGCWCMSWRVRNEGFKKHGTAL